MPYLSDQLARYMVVATDWTADPPPSIASDTSVVSGGTSDFSHSANVAVRVRFKGTSDQAFPSNANFVPGIPQSAIDENTVTSVFQGHLFNAYVNLIDLAATFGAFPAWRWVITSRILAGAYRASQAFSRTDFIQFPSPTLPPPQTITLKRIS